LWVTLNNNFLDIAVLEWCKLFGDDSGVHRWRKAVSNPDSFRAGLLTELSFSPVEWEDYIGEQRTYRDKFVAHLDKLPVMNIPDLTASLTSVTALHSTLRREDCASYLQDLDRDLAAYQTVLSSKGDALYQLAQE
jgi:hypothetical protein